MTPFASLQSLCGLSNGEAAAFLDVSEDTIKSWRNGRRAAPEGALEELLDLWGALDNAASEAADEMMRVFHEQGALPGVIEIGYPADDHEAQALGFPCGGAWRQMAGRLVDELTRMYDEPVDIRRIKFVPRGSTLATAAAADVHKK